MTTYLFFVSILNDNNQDTEVFPLKEHFEIMTTLLFRPYHHNLDVKFHSILKFNNGTTHY